MVKQDYSLFVLQYLLEAPGEMARCCAGCFLHSPGVDSLFTRGATTCVPRHTQERPLSLLWENRTDVESASTSTVGGRARDPSEHMALPCAGSLLGNANKALPKCCVLTEPLVRKGGVASKGTMGCVCSRVSKRKPGSTS